jgi:hypothetical protein
MNLLLLGRACAEQCRSDFAKKFEKLQQIVLKIRYCYLSREKSCWSRVKKKKKGTSSILAPIERKYLTSADNSKGTAMFLASIGRALMNESTLRFDRRTARVDDAGAEFD